MVLVKCTVAFVTHWHRSTRSFRSHGRRSHLAPEHEGNLLAGQVPFSGPQEVAVNSLSCLHADCLSRPSFLECNVIVFQYLCEVARASVPQVNPHRANHDLTWLGQPPHLMVPAAAGEGTKMRIGFQSPVPVPIVLAKLLISPQHRL
jgi:hypothetical protein